MNTDDWSSRESEQTSQLELAWFVVLKVAVISEVFVPVVCQDKEKIRKRYSIVVILFAFLAKIILPIDISTEMIKDK